MSNIFELSEKQIVNPQEQEETRCRICYDNAKPLISVCACSGSIAYVHEDCILDWITKKLQAADRVQIPYCQICHQRFNAKMKVSKKKLCLKLLIEKILKTSKKDTILLIIHTIVLILAIIQIINFVFSLLSGKLMDNIQFYEIFGKIFTHFICQIYVISFFSSVVKQKKWIINQSMIQVVQVTLKPRSILKK